MKRWIDIISSLILLAILGPLLALAILALLFANKGRAFFLQVRPGKNGTPFRIIKLKTMSDAKGVDGEFLPDAARLHRTGAFVRKLSLDEVPQLFNVIKGDMSLVGPRPLLMEYLPLYSDVQSRRHEVRPGITGWAQVKGRNALSWEEKFSFDVWYVDHLSFLLDLKILGMTFIKVLRSEGISGDNSVSMTKFEGNKI